MDTHTNTDVPTLVPVVPTPTVPTPMFVFTDASISMKVSTMLLNNPHLIQLLCVWKSGHTFSWHAGIPEVHSESFGKILASNVLSDLLPEYVNELVAIKKYMYTGQLEVPMGSILDLNDVVTELKFDQLMRAIASNITFDSTDEMFDAFKRVIISENIHLREACFEKFILSFNEIPTEKILGCVEKLSHDQVLKIFQTETLHIGSDSEVKLAVILNAWKLSHPYDIQSDLKALVRFDCINPSDLITTVKSLKLLSGTEYTDLLENIVSKNLKSLRTFDKKKIFVCNTAESVSSEYRRVTEEEVLTENFQQIFFAQAELGFESLGEKNVDFINVTDKRAITYRNSTSFVHLDTGGNKLYKIRNWNIHQNEPHLGLCVSFCGITANDAYLYVKA